MTWNRILLLSLLLEYFNNQNLKTIQCLNLDAAKDYNEEVEGVLEVLGLSPTFLQ